MKIEGGTTTGNGSISIIAEAKNILEFIHIFDRNNKKLGMLSIYNKSNGNTIVEYDITGD